MAADPSSLMRKAERQAQLYDRHQLQDAGLIPKDASSYYPTIYYPPIPMYGSSSEAAILKDHGVGWISLGGQALDNKSLKNMGRKHWASDVRQAMDTTRSIGFTSVSIDLIYGEAGRTARPGRTQ